MKNFKKLSREELKNTFGGLKACKLVIQGSDGKWITRNGSCETTTSVSYLGDIPFVSTSSYCETGLGDVPLKGGRNSNC